MTQAHVSRALSFVVLCAALLWASEAAALEPGGFTLETGSPDALCPELEATREIVARRLGSLIVEGRKEWLARYTIGHAPTGSPRDFVRLELFNPEGKVELRRDLPIEGDSCRTMSEVIALVLDRHFRGLVATDERPPPPVEATPPASSVSVSSQAQTPRQYPPAPAAQLDATGRGGRLSAEYAATLAQPHLGLRVSARLGPKLEAALGLRWGLSSLEESEPRGARVAARVATARTGLAWRLALPPGLLHFGPVVSVALQRATTEGLPVASDQIRPLWMAGLEAGFVVPLGRRLFVESSFSLDFLVPGAGQLFIDNREVLAPSAVTLGCALGFGYAWGNK
ncbi:MAG TPA: hypothetical protein VJV79_01825 [Polyangiaceae bacterium]|nr:hypothetical protein [Polyangiaceae bacterium]